LVVVKKWLESLASGNWIMIIDNFDEVDSYAAEYLPMIRGAILFTTRDKVSSEIVRTSLQKLA